ncbi:MAG TPA: Wzz/FepE/Etk N-terminal domain-containing protein, partial [Caulobacteraceae bacterium]|nr:Wzz/FepE/Etk N-terminal domain-containing protein [Caulobacteraceae bacterium]
MSEDVWFPAFPGAAGEGGRFRRPRYSPADLLAMLWRERVLMTAVFAAFAIAGLLFVVVARTVYPAEAILLVRPAQEPIRRAGAAPWTVTDAQAATQSEAAILTSTPVKQKVIQRIGSGTLFPDLGGDEAEATAQLTRDLKIQISAGSPVIRLSYAHPDPALAARALNT